MMNDETLEGIYDDILMEEGVASTIGHVLLDLGGVIADPAGGAGAWFDAANALWYIKENNYLYAAFSLISAIPIIGDIVGKGGKYIHALGGIKAGASMYKAGKVMKSANTVSKISKVKSIIKSADFQEKIGNIFDIASKNEKLAPHVEGMKNALNDFAEQETMQV